jgi:pyruvate formate lyase activating enzyme
MTAKTRTPEKTLNTARDIALSMGIKYCYVGNIHSRDGQTTYCPNCKTPLIKRDWHSVLSNKMKDRKCYKCGAEIDGIF